MLICQPGQDECGINAICDSLLEICICQEDAFGVYPGCCKENCERKPNGNPNTEAKMETERKP